MNNFGTIKHEHSSNYVCLAVGYASASDIDTIPTYMITLNIRDVFDVPLYIMLLSFGGTIDILDFHTHFFLF